MSKIYYIYHIPEYVYSDGSIGKIGVSYRLTRRMKENLKKSLKEFTKWEVLEEHTDIYKVSDREIELQKEYQYKVDVIPYWKTATKISTKESRIRGGLTSGKQNVESGHLARARNLSKLAHNHRRKRIIQFDLSGNFIKEWESLNECSRKLVISKGHISNICNGKGKIAKGFFFKYKED